MGVNDIAPSGDLEFSKAETGKGMSAKGFNSDIKYFDCKLESM